jgi:hypothetical protein
MNHRPILFPNPDSSGEPLARVQARVGGTIDESWVQQFLFEHPELLPVREFDEAFSPAIALGREVESGAGPIDLLLVSPQGRLVIVETKLWKNPEKHRAVVAQIIDYAKELSSWDVDTLEKTVNKSLRQYSGEAKSFDSMITPALEYSGMDKESFQEQLLASLRNGEFLLLIVGDRISPNVALLSESITSAPGLNFRFGLVELQMYRVSADAEWPLLVIPDIVGRTVEKERGVIRVQYEQVRPKVEVLAEEGPATVSQGKTNRIAFLSLTRPDLRPVFERWLDRWEELWSCNWGVKGFSLRIPINGALQSVLLAYPDWAVSIVREDDLALYGMRLTPFQIYRERITGISAAIGVLRAQKRYVSLESLSAGDLDMLFDATTELFLTEITSVDTRESA